MSNYGIHAHRSIDHLLLLQPFKDLFNKDHDIMVAVDILAHTPYEDVISYLLDYDGIYMGRPVEAIVLASPPDLRPFIEHGFIVYGFNVYIAALDFLDRQSECQVLFQAMKDAMMVLKGKHFTEMYNSKGNL